MLTVEEIERNRALRIAYRHARVSAPWVADAWLEFATEFARPTDRQLSHFEALVASHPAISPDQLAIDDFLTPTEEVQAA